MRRRGGRQWGEGEGESEERGREIRGEGKGEGERYDHYTQKNSSNGLQEEKKDEELKFKKQIIIYKKSIQFMVVTLDERLNYEEQIIGIRGKWKIFLNAIKAIAYCYCSVLIIIINNNTLLLGELSLNDKGSS